MKYFFTTLIFTFLLVLTQVNSGFAQGDFSVHAGAAVPLSDFADDSYTNMDAAGAAVGFNLGLKYVHPLSENGLGVFGSFDFNYNGIKQSLKDDIEDMFAGSGIEFKWYKYINMPITLGLDYKYEIAEGTSIFGNGGLALNFLKLTDFEMEMDGQTSTTSFDIGTSVGFKLGAGIILQDKYSLSLNYLGLGEPSVSGETDGQNVGEDLKTKVSMLTVAVGYHF